MQRGTHDRWLPGRKPRGWLWVLGFALLALAACAPGMNGDDAAAAPVSVSCDHRIDNTLSIADGLTDFAGVQPGDTVCIEAGTRSTLKLRNFSGAAQRPITFVNAGETVVIHADPDDHAGIDIRNSEHIRLTGAGSQNRCGVSYSLSEQQCGIVILGGARGVAGSDKTGHIEIDHVGIQGPSKMGIVVKSNDKYGVHRSEWVQQETYLHHNYIYDAGTEGFYIGSSFYEAGDDPLLEGVEISHNLIVRAGWDGLQVGSAVADCRIHHNRIVQAGLANHTFQRSGIMNNPGSTCHIYNNRIVESVSRAIYLQGNGGNQVYNNVIVRPGRLIDEKGDGIVVSTGSNPGEGIRVWGNLIIEPSRYGILFRNEQGENHRIAHNIIVNPGRSPDAVSAAGDDGAFVQYSDAAHVSIANNLFFEGDIAQVCLSDSESNWALSCLSAVLWRYVMDPFEL